MRGKEAAFCFYLMQQYWNGTEVLGLWFLMEVALSIDPISKIPQDAKELLHGASWK
jgi:hypothetical protein